MRIGPAPGGAPGAASGGASGAAPGRLEAARIEAARLGAGRFAMSPAAAAWEPRARRAGPGDLDDLARIAQSTFAHYGVAAPAPSEIRARLARHLDAEPGFEALVVDGPDGGAVGHALFAPLFWTSDLRIALFLKEIFVLAPWRGRGAGMALFSALAAECLERGWARMAWTVDRANAPAASFYGRLAARVVHDKEMQCIEENGLRGLAEGRGARSRRARRLGAPGGGAP